MNIPTSFTRHNTTLPSLDLCFNFWIDMHGSCQFPSHSVYSTAPLLFFICFTISLFLLPSHWLIFCNSTKKSQVIYSNSFVRIRFILSIRLFHYPYRLSFTYIFFSVSKLQIYPLRFGSFSPSTHCYYSYYQYYYQ